MANDDLKVLNTKRGGCKASFTNHNKYLETIKVKDNLTDLELIELQERIVKINTNFEEFQNIQLDIEVVAEDIDKQYKIRQEVEDRYYSIVALAKSILQKFKSIDDETSSFSQHSNDLHASTSDVSHNSHNSHIQGVKLPTIQLPKFDGNYEQWLEFRDTFESLIHKNDKIIDIQKYHYLRSSLQGNALAVIKPIEFSAVGYNLAWESVCERYNNNKLLIHNHIKALFSLEAVHKESYIKFRKLVDDFSKHLRSLEQLGQPCNQWDALLIFIITNKLDENTLREWEKQHASSSQLPTLSELKAFLKARADLLEAIEMNSKTRFKQNDPKTTRSYSVTSYSCILCNGNHSIYSCQTFLEKSVKDRWSIIKAKRLCTNCLRAGHANRQCKLGPCRSCKAWHNSLLHSSKVNKPNDTSVIQNDAPCLNPINDVSNNNEATTSHDSTITLRASNTSLYSNVNYAYLSTAIVKIKDRNGKFHNARALLDSGSQSSFITTSFCDKLGIEKTKTNVELSGIANKLSFIKGKCSIEVNSTNGNFSQNIICYLLPSIANITMHPNSSAINSLIPKNVQLADPHFSSNKEIDILLGVDIFWNLIGPGRINVGEGPVLIETVLGWIISGPIGPLNYRSTSCNLSTNHEINKLLQRFWEVEELSQSPSLSEEQLFCENNFKTTTVRDPSGRFIVTIPLKQSPEVLGASKDQAERRFYLLERRLAKNEVLRERYVNFMKEYQELNHMTLDTTQSNSVEYYTPHHGVLKEDSLTTKLRVVFDASASTTSGLSLNNIQCVGPTIQQDLFSILVRFRRHKYVLSADIAKMYRQVLIAKEQRSLQKIFWRENSSDTLQSFKLNTVTYGQASASFLAIRCIFELANEFESIKPEASKILRRDFYVDDLLSGADTIKDAKHIVEEVSHILSTACFSLRKWTSNEPSILNAINNKDESLSVLQFEKNETIKTLGLIWSCESDTLRYEVDCNPAKFQHSKREVLSIIAKLYDPLGLVSPSTIIAKIFMQKLWSEGLNWDERLPTSLLKTWTQFKDDLFNLKKLDIPRHVICDDVQTIEIHGFSDASQQAYGACIYIKSTSSDGKVKTQLLCAKSKVAPIKSISIPRLELCGALLLARLLVKVIEAMEIKFHNCILWSDSTIVLAWINSSPNNLQTFVSNRVSEIQSLTNSYAWKYVPSETNPADCLSRGLLPRQLLNFNLWWNGPPWLALDSENWPILNQKIDVIPELKPTCTIVVTNEQPSWFPFNRFSKYSRLLRSFAYLLRFTTICRLKKNQRKLGPLTLREINTSRSYLIKLSQNQSFSEEIKTLTNSKSVSLKSKLSSLNPFLDQDGIMRVGGRLANSEFPFDKKFPIIIDSKHVFTILLFRYEHLRLYHAGPQHLLSIIRETYWPISGRNLSRLTVKQCTACARYNPKPLQPIMGDLPSDRLSFTFPFAVTGIDYAGPFLCKNKQGRGSKLNKCYVSLFVCFATKALHLELVSDLSTNSFIMALRRFIARRGKPTKLYSDNGKNFVGAISEFKNFLKTNNNNIQGFCTEEGIDWHLIPPYSPHFGGLWEAGIKAVKRHLLRSLNNSHLTFEEFSTVLSQIESVLNSRPISPLSTDPNDLSPLTPAHFLIGRPATLALDQDLLQATHLDRFQKVQQIFQYFWKRWSSDYVCELQKRTKWKHNRDNLVEGTLVIIKDDSNPPARWKMGRIVRVHLGSQGVSRVAQVKVQDGLITRAFSKLCPLPVPVERS